MSTHRSFEDILALAKPREETVTLCLDGSLAADADRLIAQLNELDRPGARSSLADGAQRAKLAGELDDLRELMKLSEVTFRFQALPSKEYSDMLAAHPSSDPNKALDVQGLQPDLIARCAIEPKMSREQVDQLLDRINEWQRDRLFDAAWNANNAAVAIPSSRAASASPSLSDAR